MQTHALHELATGVPEWIDQHVVVIGAGQGGGAVAAGTGAAGRNPPPMPGTQRDGKDGTLACLHVIPDARRERPAQQQAMRIKIRVGRINTDALGMDE